MVEIKNLNHLKGQSVISFLTSEYHSKGHVEWSLHGHEFLELELFIDGKGYQILNGKRYEIEEGIIHLITTFDFHEMVWDDIKQVGMRFDQHILNRNILEKIFSAKEPLVFKLEGEEFEWVKRMMLLVYGINKSGKEIMFKQELNKNLLETIIIILLNKLYDDDNGGKSQINHVQRAIAYLEMNFKNTPSLNEVAKYVGLNPNYFSGLFCDVTGKTFVKYLTDLKLEYSKNLIISSNMTMNEVCFNSGFKSFSNFSREFKKKYEVTPLQFRKKQINKQKVTASPQPHQF